MKMKKDNDLFSLFRSDENKSSARVALNIDSELYGKIKELAETSKMSKASFISEVLNDFVSKGRANEAMFIEPDSTGRLSSRKRPITKKSPRVFLSHNHKDKQFVRNLGIKLKESGIHVWIDEAEIMHGQSLIETLRGAIDSVDLLIAVISPSSIASSWVQKEIDIAMNAEIKSKRIRVIPILRKGTVLPGFLEGKLYADFTTPYKQRKNVAKLIESIYKLAKK